MPKNVPTKDKNNTGPYMQGTKTDDSKPMGGGGPFGKKEYGNHKGGGGSVSVTQRLNSGTHHTTGKSE